MGTIGSAASQDFAHLQLAFMVDGVERVLVAAAKNPDVNVQQTLIVFEKYPGYTWLMNIDGSNPHSLSPTTGGGWMEPRFTPDGRHVVVTHDVGDRNEIFSIDVSTGSTVQLTDAPQYPWKWRPSVSPSGTQLIVTYGSDSLSSQGLRSHVGSARLGAGLITEFTPLTPVDTTRPSFDGELSPDGSRLTFDAGGRIWVARSDGSAAAVVAAGRLGRFDRSASDQILFTHDVGPINTHTQLWSAAVDGSRPHMVWDANIAESFCTVS
jgi:Tol biopolymer transport system component